MRRIWVSTFILVFALLAGCSSIAEKRKIDYKTTKTLPPLEVPPDLAELPGQKRNPTDTLPRSSATYSEYLGEQKSQQTAPATGVGSEVLPQFKDVQIVRAGTQRWLVVGASPEALWPEIRKFVLVNGLLIAKENPKTGIIETEWAENRAQVGTAIQRTLAKWLNQIYSTGLRDKYRIRLERGTEPNTTEIFLSHFGMEEVIATEERSDHVQTLWQPRASDPGLEAELLRLLMVQLGVKQEVAQTKLATQEVEERATLVRNGDGTTWLSLQDSLDRAWRRVGLSLDRIGFTVEDRDRSKGIYFVRYLDPENVEKKKGFFARMFSGEDEPKPKDHYQIYLKEASAGTDVQVLSQAGELETSQTGERILSLLYEQLR